MDGKITKLPKSMDPFEITKKKIREKYHTCPFCGESRPLIARIEAGKGLSEGISCILLHADWRPLNRLCFWEKHYFFYRYDFRCNTCGAEWQSEEFPDLGYSPSMTETTR